VNIFHRSISGASYLEFNPSANHIVYKTRMYVPSKCNHEMREVTIDEEEWLAIVKYGEEAGFEMP
jgi:hypothetical protein